VFRYFFAGLVLVFLLLIKTAEAVASAESLNADSLTRYDDFRSTLAAVLASHPAIKGADAELASRRYAIKTAETQRYPTLSARANNLTDGDERSLLIVQQPLWAFGKIDTDIELRRAEFFAEQWNLRQVQRQLLEEAAQLYIQIQGLAEQNKIARESIELHEELYQSISRRRSGKLASVADVKLAFSRLTLARTQSLQIESQQQATRAELSAMTRRQLKTGSPIPRDVLALPPPGEIESQAYGNSADIRYKRERLNAMRLELKSEKRSILPTVSLRFEQELSDTENISDETRLGISIEATAPGLGLANYQSVKSVQETLQAAQYAVDVSVIDVQRNIRTLTLNRESLARLSREYQKAINASAQTLASFKRQYQAGRKSWLEVLNTLRELTELKLQQVQTESDERVAYISLIALIGGLDEYAGLQPVNGDMTP